jgi:hypothetical protein
MKTLTFGDVTLPVLQRHRTWVITASGTQVIEYGHQNLSVNFRYINTLIVILTTSIFIGLITREYRDLERYMGYVAENGRSALSHAEYINQNMAFQLSRAFSFACLARCAKE